MTKWLAQLVWLLMMLSLSACGEATFHGKSVDEYFPDPQQAALSRAAADGDLSQIDKLISQGADVNYTGIKNLNALYWAMLTEQDAAFEHLLEHGADPEQRIFTDKPIIISAAMYKDPTYLRLLLAHGANVDSTVGGHTALREAALRIRFENVKFLVEHCADLHLTGPSRTVAAVQSLSNGGGGDGYDISLYLLDQGSNYNLYSMARRLVGTGSVPTDPKLRQGYEALKAIFIERGVDMDRVANGRVERSEYFPPLPDKPVYGKDCRHPPTK